VCLSHRYACVRYACVFVVSLCPCLPLCLFLCIVHLRFRVFTDNIVTFSGYMHEYTFCIYYVHLYCSKILSAQEGRALEMVVRVLLGGAWCVCLRSSFLAPMSPAERCARLESVGEASDLGAYLAGSRLCFCHVYRTHTCSCRPHTLILTHSQQSLHTQLFFL
jgi:hypothetical protein